MSYLLLLLLINKSLHRSDVNKQNLLLFLRRGKKLSIAVNINTRTPDFGLSNLLSHLGILVALECAVFPENISRDGQGSDFGSYCLTNIFEPGQSLIYLSEKTGKQCHRNKTGWGSSGGGGEKTKQKHRKSHTFDPAPRNHYSPNLSLRGVTYATQGLRKRYYCRVLSSL